MTKKEDEELKATHERVARDYRAKHPGVASSSVASGKNEPVKKTEVPKEAKQPVGAEPKPYAGRKPKPQAQVHSSP